MFIQREREKESVCSEREEKRRLGGSEKEENGAEWECRNDKVNNS